MGIENAKHIVSEIDGVRCTIVETRATIERAAFLNDLLSLNGYEVKEIKEPLGEGQADQLYTIGVTDVVFNPVFAIYERKLKTREGSVVTPGYWRQECNDCDSRYWLRRKGAHYPED